METFLIAKSGSKKQNQNTSYISTVYFPCLVSHFNYWLVVGFIEREKTAVGGEWLGGATFGTIYDTEYFVQTVQLQQQQQ